MSADARPPQPSPFLPLKLALFGAGAAFGLTGMFTRKDIFVSIGIAFLAIGIVVRMLEGRSQRERERLEDIERASGADDSIE
jgi:hypothetical protein